MDGGTLTEQTGVERALRRLKRRPLLIAGWLAAFTAAVHLLGGTPQTRPMLDSALDADLRLLLYACWHGISVVLAFSAVALFVAARSGADERHRSMAVFVSAVWVAFGLVFIGVALIMSGPAMLLNLPQWTLLLPVGVLGLYGSYQ